MAPFPSERAVRARLASLIRWSRTSDRSAAKQPTKSQADDPQTLIGLIWRVIEDSARVVRLIVLLAAVAAIVFVLLAWVHVSAAGTVSCGVLLVSMVLRWTRRGR